MKPQGLRVYIAPDRLGINWPVPAFALKEMYWRASGQNQQILTKKIPPKRDFLLLPLDKAGLNKRDDLHHAAHATHTARATHVRHATTTTSSIVSWHISDHGLSGNHQAGNRSRML